MDNSNKPTRVFQTTLIAVLTAWVRIGAVAGITFAELGLVPDAIRIGLWLLTPAWEAAQWSTRDTVQALRQAPLWMYVLLLLPVGLGIVGGEFYGIDALRLVGGLGLLCTLLLILVLSATIAVKRAVGMVRA